MKLQLSTVGLLAMAAIGYGPASVDAQWYAGPQVNANGGVGFGLGYGGGYGGGWGGAQTPFSAGATGMGNLVRAEGAYNEQTSRANINNQQARSLYIDNEQKAYAARQSVYRAARAMDVENWEAAKAGVAKADEYIATHQPSPLSNGQLHPSTGHIEWPVALTAKEFEEPRTSLDELFETRMKSGASARLASQIEKKTNELKDSLREHITKMPLKDYSEARRFLDSMYASAR